MPFPIKDNSSWDDSSEGLDDNIKKARFSVKSDRPIFPNKTLRVITNIDTGNYDVYETFPGASDVLIYSYNASTDETVTKNDSLYKSIFDWSDEGRKQKITIDNDVRRATASLSQDRANSPLPGKVNQNRKTNEELQNKPGYKSLVQSAEPPDAGAPDAGDANAGDGVLPDDQPQNEETDSTNSSLFDQEATEGSGFGGGEAPTFTKKFYRYPLEIPPGLTYDYIKFTSLKYVPSGLDVLGKKQNRSATLFTKKNIQETIILPMIPAISESNTVNWGSDNLGFIAALAGEAAQKGVESVGSLLTGKFNEFGSGVSDAFRSLGSNLDAISRDATARQAIAAYFAGQIVGSNLLTRNSGAVVNPNMELLFRGPELRGFGFTFNFTPRYDKEAKEIRDIIKVFKKNMAVQRSSSNLFLKTPNVFQIEYIFNGNTTNGQHPFLNKFKVCALTGFNVDYTPNGSYMTYQTGSMTRYSVTMSFKEIEPIYADEYNESELNTGF